MAQKVFEAVEFPPHTDLRIKPTLIVTYLSFLKHLTYNPGCPMDNSDPPASATINNFCAHVPVREQRILSKHQLM